MSPRKRSLNNRDLEGTNIIAQWRKPVGSKGHYEYRYRMPAFLPTGEPPENGSVPLGNNRKEAIETALILNERLRPAGSIAERILNIERKKSIPMDNVNKLVDEFIESYIPSKNYSKKTLDGKMLQLKKLREAFGEQSTSGITTRDIVLFLNPLQTDPYIKYRVTLLHLFTFAIHQGYRENNPVTATMTKTSPKRRRAKHSMEGWNKIRSAAPEWLQRAMDIAILSLQRRSDLVSLNRQQVNLEKGTIRILQDKTRNYKHPVYIEIAMGEDLFRAIKRCYQTGIHCPYLIHYRPLKMSRADQDAKTHPFAVTESHLTKTFSKVRDTCGAYDHIARGERPTFHDARGLGAYLYEKAGFTSDYIQSLTGHSSKEMLDHYIQGHEPPVPVQVSAGLLLPGTAKLK